MTNFTTACFFIIFYFVTDDERWASIGDLTFGIKLVIGLVGMLLTGFTLKRKLIQAGCQNMKALKVF
jgi:hypothetical protein